MCMEMNTPRTSIARCIVTGEKINYNWSLETKTVKAFLNGYINIPISTLKIHHLGLKIYPIKGYMRSV